MDDVRPISIEDLMSAATVVFPTVSAEELRRLNEWNEQF